MEARYKAEKERHALVLQRAQTSSGLNDDLKKEYETQLAIFKVYLLISFDRGSTWKVPVSQVYIEEYFLLSWMSPVLGYCVWE